MDVTLKFNPPSCKPDCSSDGFVSPRLLIVSKQYSPNQPGMLFFGSYILRSGEWRIEGSPSKWDIDAWAYCPQLSKLPKPKTYPRWKTHTAVMGNGNDKPSRVIDGDKLMEYVGIGWIEIRQATIADKKRYPTLE